MRQDKIRRAGSTGPLFLLLLLVTTGLFAMHTLGHSGAHDSSRHEHGMCPAAAPAQSQSGMAADHDDSTGSNAKQRWPGKPLPFGSLAACMAVLGTFLALVLAALLSTRFAGWTAGLPRLTRRVTDMVRGPPGVPIGLLVADLSVARN